MILKWIGDHPGDEIEAFVRSDLEHLWTRTTPSNLITHTVFLSENFEGPSVSVWGEEGVDDAVWCEFFETTEFVSLGDA